MASNSLLGEQLIAACFRDSNVEEALRLLEAGADIAVVDAVRVSSFVCVSRVWLTLSSTQQNERTPLHCAAWCDGMDVVVRQLIAMGANVNAKARGAGSVLLGLIWGGADAGGQMVSSADPLSPSSLSLCL